MKSNAVLTTIFVVLLAVVLAGEAYVYMWDTDRNSSDVYETDDGIGYTITSGGSEVYSVLLMDNAFDANAGYYVYYDERYHSNVERVATPIGARAFTEDYYISQLVSMLRYRDISIEMLNADELAEKMISGDTSKGLIMLSGAIPDTVYGDAKKVDIIDWLNDGGRLYWAGNFLGAFISTMTGVVPVTGDYQTAFLGSKCLNDSDTVRVLSDITSTNNFRNTLSLKSNEVKYGIRTDDLTRTFLAVGYTDGEYSSIVMTECGNGMICILGGDYSNNQRHDLAQLLSSGISFSSKEIGYAEGSVKRTTVTGEITEINATLSTGDSCFIYVYYGKYYPVYAMFKELVIS